MALQNWYSRRKVLAGIGTAGLPFAGCTAKRSNETTATSETSRTSSVKQPTTTVTATTETCRTDGETTYTFGEWESAVLDGTTRWEFTVTNVESFSSFTVSDTGKTYELPEGERLVITTTKIKNVSSSLDSWEHGYLFVFVLPDGSVLKPKSTFEHPEFSDPVPGRKLEEVSNMKQYRAEGYTVSPGETGKIQWMAVLPRDVSVESLQIGFDPSEPESPDYPIRWVSGREC